MHATRFNREPPRARELDVLIDHLLAEIAKLISEILTATHAGERPVAELAGVLDAVTEIKLFAVQQGRS